MLFQRINESSPERFFVIVKNSYSTASLTAGQWVAWDDLTDEDGVAVTKPNGVLRGSIAGVANDTITHGSFGIAQVWGFREAARGAGGSGLATSKISEGTFLYCKTSGFAVHGLHTIASTVTIPTWRLDKVGRGMSPSNTAAKATSATTASFKVFINCI